MNPFLGREIAAARVEELLDEAASESRARLARAGDRARRGDRGVRALLGRRLVGMGSRLMGVRVEVR